MATTRVTMPQLGESVHEGTISRWLVKPGDRVVEFEPMLEVDTDKVNAEVPAPVTGVLKEIIAKEGETVQAGSDIAVVELEGDGQAPATAQPGAEDAQPTEVKQPITAGGGDAMPSEKQAEAADGEPRPQPMPTGGEPMPTGGEPMPTGGEPMPAGGEPPAAGGQARVEPATHPSPAGPGAAAARPAAGPDRGGEHGYSPAVQMLAEEHAVDLSAISGTGLGGRVTKKDVQRFLESGQKPARPAASPAAAQVAAAAGDEVVPLTRMRRLIAENTTRSKATIPHAWQTQEVDMSGVVASRNANKAAFQQREGFSLTYLPYVIAAAATALREHPDVNATFNETEIIVHRNINIGVSVGLEDTLVVPVILGADGLSLTGIARAINDIAGRARSKQLKADALQGGTFTVNNSGTFGTLLSYSVINPGQAGILTMEAIVERPVAVKGMIGIKPMMYLCFSFDHRILDGLMAARFLTSCRATLESVTAETPIY